MNAERAGVSVTGSSSNARMCPHSSLCVFGIINNEFNPSHSGFPYP